MNKGNEVHHPICGAASCGGPGSFYAHMIFRILNRHLFLRSRSHQWMASCFHFHSRQKHPLVTAGISICNMESSDLVSNLSGMTLLSKGTISTKLLWIGTRHGSASFCCWIALSIRVPMSCSMFVDSPPPPPPLPFTVLYKINTDCCFLFQY